MCRLGRALEKKRGKECVARLERMKRGNGIKDQDDDFSYSIPSLFRVMESGSRSPRFDGLELLSPPPLRLTPRNSLSFLVFITCNKTT